MFHTPTNEGGDFTRGDGTGGESIYGAKSGCPEAAEADGGMVDWATAFRDGEFGERTLLRAPGLTRNKGLTTSNKKLVETSALLVVTGALLVVTRS